MNREAERPTRAARLPASSLAALADLRRDHGVGVILDGEHAWIRWQAEDDRLALRVMAVPGSELFDLRGGLWYPTGGRLPRFGLPLDSSPSTPLHRAITPRPVQPEEPGPVPTRPTVLGLARDGVARPATALVCALEDLALWADRATSAEIESLSAATCGDLAMLRGRLLPPIPEGERFWGRSVLAPLGFRPDPDLPEVAIRGALSVSEDDLLVLRTESCEVVPRDAFQPLSRASVRRALAGGTR